MKQVTQSGATVEEAISAALKKLEAARDDVTIRVIEEGKKGFFGFGSKLAEVEVTLTEPVLELPKNSEAELPEKLIAEEPAISNVPADQAVEQAEVYLQQVAAELGVYDLQIRTEQRGKNVTMYLESEKAAILIGKRGQTLNALQQLTFLVANKFSNQFIMIRLDTENYRERRQEALKLLADRMADKAVRTGQKVKLEPMPSHERKAIHHALSTRLDVETYSEGKDPKRYLVIEPIK